MVKQSLQCLRISRKVSGLCCTKAKRGVTLRFYSFPLGLAVQGVFFLLLIASILHVLDRQGDFVARTDFIWKAKLKVEQEEVETMRGINKVFFRLVLLIAQ